MADKPPTIIKKYANRRLYHMGTSTYVTLEDLSVMVRAGEDFTVYDAKSGEDITRSVLAQIIFEQENKEGQNLLPATFLRQVIRFYGDSMQSLVPRYLEFSMEKLAREQQTLRDQMAKTFTPAAAFHAIEDQVRANMSFFTEAMRMFAPFSAMPQAAGEDGAAPGQGAAQEAPGETPSSRPGSPKTASSKADQNEIESLKARMGEMQQKLDALSAKDKAG